MKRQINPISLLLYLVVLLALVYLVFSFAVPSGGELSYSQVLDLFESQDVRSFSLTADGNLTLELYSQGEGSRVRASIGDVEQFHEDLDTYIASQYAGGVLVSYDYPPEPGRFKDPAQGITDGKADGDPGLAHTGGIAERHAYA